MELNHDVLPSPGSNLRPIDEGCGSAAGRPETTIEGSIPGAVADASCALRGTRDAR
jgi:hypothetical protein